MWAARWAEKSRPRKGRGDRGWLGWCGCWELREQAEIRERPRGKERKRKTEKKGFFWLFKLRFK
jgi:hypothetical protein